MPQRILIVEDEPAIADNITYALATEGFEPIWRGTGKEALEVLKSSTVDLIVLDLGLPDINGFDLLKEISAIGPYPVIILTARSEEVDKIVGLELGADDYLTKPFSPRELSARVKAVLRRSSSAADSPAAEASSSQSAFVVDSYRHQISFHAVALELSPYEYRILEVLINYPGRVFTRERLMELAWEEPDMSLERTVDAHIKNLRQKLRQIRPNQNPIRTHRGVGYSLEEDSSKELD